MSELGQPSTNPTDSTIVETTPSRQPAAIFGAPPEERATYPVMAWGVAALVAIVLAGVFVYLGRKKPEALPSTLQPADAYASSLSMTQFAMSEAANLSGGKLTYLDGHIGNTGSRTVTGVTVQVVFQNDEALAPQIYTVPLTLIRMKDPYIDTQMVSTNPLKPGDDREFRLTFETVPDNWNTQMPEVRVIQTDLK
ncbi:MAG: DUF2393 family protein [Acidobacteriota bacterium]|nr:DUF2393 family protein [Acidobacteriota bacterium]